MKKEICFVFLFCFCSLSLQATLLDGLVAHLTFDGNANDISGNGNNGTEVNGVTYGNGVFGQAAVLDGIDDHILLGSNGYSTSVGAISVWAQRTSGGVSVFTQYLTDTSRMKIFTSGQARAFSGFGSTLHNLIGPDYEDNTAFHHIVLNYNFPAGEHSLFVDGVLAASISDSNAPTPVAPGTLVIGADKDFDIQTPDNLNNHLGGAVDELRIYNRLLLQEEITELSTVVPEPSSVFLLFLSILFLSNKKRTH